MKERERERNKEETTRKTKTSGSKQNAQIQQKNTAKNKSKQKQRKQEHYLCSKQTPKTLKNAGKTLITRKILLPAKNALTRNLESRQGRQSEQTTQPGQPVHSQTRCHVGKNFFSVSTFKTKRTNHIF